MSDVARKKSDELLEQLEKKISKEYAQATTEVQAKLDDYMRRFEIKDEAWQRMVASGEKTQAEYTQWRTQQMAVGRRWEEMRGEIANDYHNANVVARRMVDGYSAEVYALNMNYSTFEIEKALGIDTRFTLYDRQAVARILRDNPELLPPPGKNMLARLAAGQDIAWQEGQIQSVMVQGILQGESIPNISKRIAATMGETNHASTIRYARTAITGAENAARADANVRAKERGCDVMQEWRAVRDGRTRHEHRYLDGMLAEPGEPFVTDSGDEILYPGDPHAAGYLVWNCRCRLGRRIAGLEPQARKYADPTIEGMSYEEWKTAKTSRSDPITKQEDIAEAMKWRTINELYRGK